MLWIKYKEIAMLSRKMFLMFVLSVQSIEHWELQEINILILGCHNSSNSNYRNRNRNRNRKKLKIVNGVSRKMVSNFGHSRRWRSNTSASRKRKMMTVKTRLIKKNRKTSISLKSFFKSWTLLRIVSLMLKKGIKLKLSVWMMKLFSWKIE